MLRYVFGGLVVIAMASVASAGHKPGHSPGGGGGNTATLGDLNCTANQIAKFNDVSGAWECALDEIGGAAFVVVDSTGQIIPHTSLAGNLTSAFLAVDVQHLGEIVTITPEVGPDGAKTSIVFYQSNDCTGQPFTTLNFPVPSL